MNLNLIGAATGCIEQAESRLEHLTVIRTFSEGDMPSRLPFMNIDGGSLFYSEPAGLRGPRLPGGDEGALVAHGFREAVAPHLVGLPCERVATANQGISPTSVVVAGQKSQN